MLIHLRARLREFKQRNCRHLRQEYRDDVFTCKRCGATSIGRSLTARLGGSWR